MLRVWFICIALLAWSAPGAAAEQAVHVIVHEGSVKQLERRHLRAIYTMHMRRWPAGPTVRVFTLPPHTQAFALFSRRCLGLAPTLLSRLWRRNIFTGIGWVPQTVNSRERMLELVGSTPGAVGFVVGERPKRPGVAVVEGLCARSD